MMFTNLSHINMSTKELNEVNLTADLPTSPSWYGSDKEQGVATDQRQIAITSEREGIFMYEVVTQKFSVLAGFGSRGFQ